MKTILSFILACFLFTGCANIGNIQQVLGTPSAVQFDIQLLGSIAKPHINADAQAKIHQVATQLNQLADLDITILTNLLPATTGSQNADALIAAAKAYLTSVLQKYGSHNATTLAYVHAVANGLLANF